MKTTYRITFRNFSIEESNVERTQELLKNLYYLENKEPENWKLFENEIDIDSQQSRGGDCVEITFAETMSANWINSIIKSINSKREVRSIEKKISNFEYEEI